MIPRRTCFGASAANVKCSLSKINTRAESRLLPSRSLSLQLQQQDQRQLRARRRYPCRPLTSPPSPPLLSPVTSERRDNCRSYFRELHAERCWCSRPFSNSSTRWSITAEPLTDLGRSRVQHRPWIQERHLNLNGKGKGKGKKPRVVVGMSGGVDSSVVAMLLKEQKYDVVGLFMRNWDEQDETGSNVCSADADLEDARRVGVHLGVPVETVDFSREYWNQVFEPSVEEFARRRYVVGDAWKMKRGFTVVDFDRWLGRCRTPNMDVACNRFIKFDAFREHALGRMDADFIATGHYARTSPGPGGDWSRPKLVQAVDHNKDQTYFLCGVPTEGLAKVLFPLGGLTKPEVRDLAAKAGLPVAQKRESMGVCFVGKRRSWADFVSQYLVPNPGNFVCADTGEIMGTHRGVQLYTVGQKSHLDGMPEKYYVAGLDPDTNSVIVARGKDNPTLFARGLSVLESEFHWVAGAPPAEVFTGADASPPAQGVVARRRRRQTTRGVESEGESGAGVLSSSTSTRGGRGGDGNDEPAAGEGAQASEGGQEEEEETTRTATRTTTSPQPERKTCFDRSGFEDTAVKAAVVEDKDTEGQGTGGVVGFRCEYRCRHRQKLLPCTVKIEREAGGAAGGGGGSDRSTNGDEVSPGSRDGGDGFEGSISDDGDSASASSPLPSTPLPTSRSVIQVSFDEPARAIAPGQVVALYKNGACLGGGAILRAEGHCSPVVVRPAPSASYHHVPGKPYPRRRSMND